MKLVLNEKLIKRNKLIGNITSYVGIAILAAGLILNLKPDPTRTLISFIALIVGFIVAQVSTYFVSRFGRSPRFDEIMADNLSKLNNTYSFYVYSSPVPMLLVGPSRIWIPIPISASGEISYDQKWRQRGGSFFMKLFGQENLGRPSQDVKSREKQIYEFLTKSLEENEIPPIKSVLVSFNPKASIGDVENAPTSIVEASATRRLIRKFDRKTEEEIPPDVLDKINDLLDG
ncbi:MAG: hypothetical protein U9R53_12250 [Chloroflexota bacterium]|nr:hypothetical protein [Chloroflexota bacterium]